jgi:hypothetical protein
VGALVIRFKGLCWLHVSASEPCHGIETNLESGYLHIYTRHSRNGELDFALVKSRHGQDIYCCVLHTRNGLIVGANISMLIGQMDG